jgi:hypothetical protein
MLVKRLILRLFAVSLIAPSSLSTALLGQAAPPTTVPAGVFHPTENTRAVSGVRIEARADGSVWFLLPGNDRIARLTGETMRQWQIRGDKKLGAHPVDFEVDGDIVWFIETGQSEIDSNQSVFARLNTATGELQEWIVRGARPAELGHEGTWELDRRPLFHRALLCTNYVLKVCSRDVIARATAPFRTPQDGYRLRNIARCALATRGEPR